MKTMPAIVMRPGWLALVMLVSGCDNHESRSARSGPLAAPAFWVWHRTSALTPRETAGLKQAGTGSLYWQVAECAWDGGWHMTRIAAPMKESAELEIVPVFRIKPEPAFLGSPDAARLFAEQIRKWSGGAPFPREIQLDFDCPDRLLGSYARFLESFGQAVAPARLSITALAGWPRNPEFGHLANSVSMLAPMFYDLAADAPADVKARHFHPMADPAMAELIRLWAACPRPWLAGLPNFERLSVFGENGGLTGHLRGWKRDPVFFHPDLHPQAAGEGVTVFEMTSTVEVSGTKIPPGGVLVHRMPDAAVLDGLVKAADRAGATGILYFALPGPGLQAAYTPSHLAHAPAEPRVLLEPGGNGGVVLKNPGPMDFPTRRWELELSSGHAGAFQSASPGGFGTAGCPGGIPAELSTTLVLRFSNLPAGQNITSGPVVRNADGLRWKIRGLTDGQPLNAADSAR